MLYSSLLIFKRKRFTLNTCYLSLIASIILLLSGCTEPHNEVSNESSEAKPTTQLQYAPVTNKERTPNWRGGAPAINKQASKINTYYHIKTLDTPKHLQLSLQFEGAQYDDASVTFKLIDGAKFTSPQQQTQWRLKPNETSEIIFSLLVPNNKSYISLTTFQNNQGATRAFLLETRGSSK